VTQTILDIPGSNDILVGGFNPSEKYEISWDDYSQYMEKYIMFQTTNQYWF
jgi:hypothetical protein